MSGAIAWRGVYPTVTTPFLADRSLDVAAVHNTVCSLLRDGVHGVVMLGRCGEAASLTRGERVEVLGAALDAAAGRVPVIAGITARAHEAAVAQAHESARLGVDALMVLPPTTFTGSREQLVAHVRAIADAVSLPIMVHNRRGPQHPDLDRHALVELARTPGIAAVEDASDDPRRVTELIGDNSHRLSVLAGIDDTALESMILGCHGWVSAVANVFPQEAVALYDALVQGRSDLATDIYRWMMPLFFRDTGPGLVPLIKLSAQIVGRGSEIARSPYHPIQGRERTRTICIIEKAVATRPHHCQRYAS